MMTKMMSRNSLFDLSVPCPVSQLRINQGLALILEIDYFLMKESTNTTTIFTKCEMKFQDRTSMTATISASSKVDISASEWKMTGSINFSKSSTQFLKRTLGG